MHPPYIILIWISDFQSLRLRIRIRFFEKKFGSGLGFTKSTDSDPVLFRLDVFFFFCKVWIRIHVFYYYLMIFNYLDIFFLDSFETGFDNSRIRAWFFEWVGWIQIRILPNIQGSKHRICFFLLNGRIRILFFSSEGLEPDPVNHQLDPVNHLLDPVNLKPDPQLQKSVYMP